MEDIFYLKQCHIFYIENFEERWIDDVDATNNDEMKAAFDKMTHFIESSFVLLSRSILSGEYIGLEDFESEITLFISDISELDFVLESDPKYKIVTSFQEINNSLFNALKRYQGILELSRRKFDNVTQVKRFSLISQKILNSLNTTPLDYFITYVVPIIKFDYNFPLNDDEFHKFLTIRTDIVEILNNHAESNPELKAIFKIILYKCNFIIRRIKFDPFFISLDSHQVLISPDNSLEIDGLKELLIKENSSNTPNSSNVGLWLSDIQQLEPKLESFIFLMRYYKQNLASISDISKIDLVIKIFDRFYQTRKNSQSYSRPKNIKDEYDNFAIDTIRNFLYNCRFSFLTKYGKLSLRELKKEISLIKMVQNNGSNVKNFHPYEKAINYLIKCIEEHLLIEKTNKILIDSELDELDNAVNLYKDAVSWSKGRKFFPFQLPFVESMVTVDGFLIFVPQVFAKVINYTTQDKNIELFNRKQHDLKLLFHISKDKEEIVELKNNIKNNDKKAYELLVLFSGIITFLFGSINIFVENKTSNLSLLIVNSSGLGIILILFVGLLLLLSPIVIQRIRFNEYIKSLRFWITVIFCIVYLGVIIIFATHQTQVNKELIINEKIEKSILEDSIRSSINDSLKRVKANSFRKKI